MDSNGERQGHPEGRASQAEPSLRAKGLRPCRAARHYQAPAAGSGGGQRPQPRGRGQGARSGAHFQVVLAPGPQDQRESYQMQPGRSTRGRGWPPSATPCVGAHARAGPGA